MKPDRLIDPFRPAEGPPPDTILAFLRWAMRGSFRYQALGGAISALSGVLEVLAALILGAVIDRALADSPDSFITDNVLMLIGVAAFFVILRPVVLGLSGLMQTVVVAPSVFNLVLSRLHRYTLGQAVSFFDNDFAGRISQKQMQAARATTDLSVDMIQTVFFALASLVGSILLMLTIAGSSALIMTLWFAAYLALIRYFMPHVRATSKARAAKRAHVTGQVVDAITNIRTVKLFAHADFEDRSAINAMEGFRQASLSFGWVSASFRFWLMALAGALPVLLIGSTLYFWSVGTATPGDIAIAGTVGMRLAQMTGWVSFTLMGMYANVGEVEDAIRTLTPTYKLSDKPDAQTLKVTSGQIALDQITFRYGSGVAGINDVSLTIAPHEKVGIVGASGAGKSTLVSLILRLYDVDAGSIRIDGQNISDVTQESLRRQIATVTQETAMFNRSAMDNIRYGDPDASDSEVIAAARLAEADDFIRGLRDHAGRTGYDAHLGERGVKISGGQRQRIAIARAVLKDAPILILDEATSALDSEVEASIQTALENAMTGKTVIAIAHRLSTLARMDRIVVLDGGRIVEQGTQDQLLALDGLYARFWKRQSGGFLHLRDAAE